MADDDKELKDQRVVTMMSPSELEAIDDWMFKNRIRSRGEAIRRLCQIALIFDESNPQTRLATDTMANHVMKLYNFISDEPLGLSPDNLQKLKDVGGAAFEAAFKVMDAQLNEILRIGDLRAGSAAIEDDLRSARKMREFLAGKSPLKIIAENPEALDMLRAEVAKSLTHKK